MPVDKSAIGRTGEPVTSGTDPRGSPLDSAIVTVPPLSISVPEVGSCDTTVPSASRLGWFFVSAVSPSL